MKRAMDALLRHTLRDRAIHPTAACLDADTAAALVDGSVSARARAAAEAHLADCSRCQALLAALVRVGPPPAERAWWRRPAIAWLAPLTVAATALAIWINVPDNARVPPTQSSRVEAPSVASAPVDPPPVAAASQPAQFSLRDVAAPTPASGGARNRQADSASAKSVVARPTPAGLADGAGARRAEAPVTAPPPPAAPPAALAPEPALVAGASRGVQGLAAGPPPAQVAQPPGPQPTVRSVAQEPARPAALAESVAIARAVPREAVISSTPNSQWRIGATGEVQHSADRGVTWQTQATGVSATLASGSSPSRSVCWLVGSAGVILITTDEGRSWSRVPFPSGADLVSVRATSDRNATVITSDGRTFVTTDGGRNWQP